jgi:ABC-type iron transport system FetAB permease component
MPQIYVKKKWRYIEVLLYIYLYFCNLCKKCIFTLAYTIFRCVILSYVTVLVLFVKHNYYNLLMSLFIYLARYTNKDTSKL